VRQHRLIRCSPALLAPQRVRLLGVLALSSGGALVTHILLGTGLALGLTFAIGTVVAVWSVSWWWAPAARRGWIARRTGAGALAGLAGTGSYDAVRFGLSHLEPLLYDPFAVMRVFGEAILGSSVPVAAAYSVGAVYHTLNGVLFGVAFAFLLGTRGVLAGIVFGLILELIMVALYPGWLSIRAYEEFVQVSGLSHLAYGGVLGAVCRRWLVDPRPA
jgi:hypothetical protein